MDWLRTAIIASLAVLLQAVAPLHAAELLMFESPGCHWCIKWHAEVGPGYAKTAEGQRAPLRVLQLSQGAPAGVALATPVTVTPTFVLVDRGRETGRIVGYPGADFFWGLFAQMLKKLPPTVAPPVEQRAEQRADSVRTPLPPSRPMPSATLHV